MVLEYRSKIPPTSVICELMHEATLRLSLKQLGDKCYAKYNVLKKKFKEECNKDGTIRRLKTLLQDIDKKRDDICAILSAF